MRLDRIVNPQRNPLNRHKGGRSTGEAYDRLLPLMRNVPFNSILLGKTSATQRRPKSSACLQGCNFSHG